MSSELLGHFSKLQRLQILALPRSSWGVTKPEPLPLSEGLAMLATCHDLLELNLDGSSLTDAATATMVGRGCPYIRSLSLEACALSDAFVLALPSSLRYLASSSEARHVGQEIYCTCKSRGFA